ncbi:MAG: hypothetical protein WAQ98_04685 [Blastocatellia bacterium]
MKSKELFPYISHKGILMPFVPIRLVRNNLLLDTKALVDTGAVVNVVPYQSGLALGGIWNDKLAKLSLGGALAGHSSCPFFLYATVGSFQPIKMGCAWADTDDIPVILGNVNFFDEFDVCFYRKDKFFELIQH